MKKILLWATMAIVLGTVNFLIIRKEGTLARGRIMFFRLAPVDPRSLIQGDYMQLAYEMARKIPRSRLKSRGCIVVTLTPDKVARFLRVHKREALQKGEYLLAYTNRGGMRLGAESFLFQEGTAHIYTGAKYGELRVDNAGTSVLIGLRDENFKRLGP